MTTKSTMPPLNLKSCSVTGSTRSSRKRISRPLLRNAISRSRSMSVWARNSVSSKIVGSGQNVTVVPRFFDGATLLDLVLRLAALRVVLHPLAAVAVDLEVEPLDSALTTDTPTPCRPPEIL